jgi:thiol-disulfide isomerase/thioredoxin
MNRRVMIPALATLVAFSTLAISSGVIAAAVKTGASKSPKPLHVSRGEPVNLADFMLPGKTTVFDFYSEYCGPCVQVAPSLEKLHRSRDDIVVVKVDINRPGIREINWRSPVAQQYGLRSIPHFKVYGADGKLLAEDGPAGARARQLVMGWVQQLK